MIERLTAGGLRGLSTEQTLSFAVPNGSAGSGITVMVGTNNAGKSTIVEALRSLSTTQVVSFSEGKRKRRFGDRIQLQITFEDDPLVGSSPYVQGAANQRSLEATTKHKTLLSFRQDATSTRSSRTPVRASCARPLQPASACNFCPTVLDRRQLSSAGTPRSQRIPAGQQPSTRNGQDLWIGVS